MNAVVKHTNRILYILYSIKIIWLKTKTNFQTMKEPNFHVQTPAYSNIWKWFLIWV